ncbi:MAG TPA: hypothetical protein VG497_08755 [Kribbella sp.]|nr:hypothetical protein [Kribbella sp.]
MQFGPAQGESVLVGAQPGSNDPGKHEGDPSSAVIGGNGVGGIDAAEVVLGR